MLRDDRSDRGLPHPIGLVVFAIFLAICAGKTSQRSQAIWLIYHWRWIVRAWIQANGLKPLRRRSPSQPTISRLLSGYDSRYLSDLMTRSACGSFADDWKDTIKKSERLSNTRRLTRRLSNISPRAQKRPMIADCNDSAPGCRVDWHRRAIIWLSTFAQQPLSVAIARRFKR